MSEDAWTRLQRWRDEGSTDGDAALDALADVGTARRLLDQTELAAVRAARRQSRSWTEIATQLGITRQSAWERWRDLDEDGSSAAAAVERAAGERVARERRRLGTVKVPDVVGLPWNDARAVLQGKGLVAMNADPDAPPPVPGETGWAVTDQSPESGARVRAGSMVRLWLERGGGSGVREPRRPKPLTREGRGMRPEPSDEAVG